VAVKVINMAGLSAREKIEVTDTRNREIGLLSHLRFKGLPLIYDHFTDAEHWYVVMEYIEGHTLEELLGQRNYKDGMPAKEVVDIGLKLCDLLGYLHAQDPPIIYRDVKPGNIMRTPNGDIYLIDFGIARTYRPGQLKDTMPLGSPGYAAPEQYGKAQTTPQTDIYGLGATLLTLLTGKEPQELRLEDIPLEKDIPLRLQELLARMMNPDPQWRPLGINAVRMLLQDKDLVEEDPLLQHKRFTILLLRWTVGGLVWGTLSSGWNALSKSVFFAGPLLISFVLFVWLAFTIGSAICSLWLSRHSNLLQGQSFQARLASILHSLWHIRNVNMLGKQSFLVTFYMILRGLCACAFLYILSAALLAPGAIALYLGILLLRHIPLSGEQYAALRYCVVAFLSLVLLGGVAWLASKLQKRWRRKAREAARARYQQQQKMQYQVQRYP
jgi:serine/threonine protein kinase